jgi:hypothetical protein
MDRELVQEITWYWWKVGFLCTIGANNSTIALITNKMFLDQHFFNENGDGLIERLKGDKFY